MSASDPSGAEMPQDEVFYFGEFRCAQCGHVVLATDVHSCASGASEVSPRSPNVCYVATGQWMQCAHCGVIQAIERGHLPNPNNHWCGAPWQTKADDVPTEWIPGKYQESEVSPRSSGGAPTDPQPSPLLLDKDELREASRDGVWQDVLDSHRAANEHIAALRTQVSALRQEAAGLQCALDLANERWNFWASQTTTARQEAETLRAQVEAAAKAAGLERTEAETLRGRIGDLTVIGWKLSNIAFNLAQQTSIDQGTRASLDSLRKEWDASIQEHVAAARVAAPREPK